MAITIASPSLDGTYKEKTVYEINTGLKFSKYEKDLEFGKGILIFSIYFLHVAPANNETHLLRRLTYLNSVWKKISYDMYHQNIVKFEMNKLWTKLSHFDPDIDLTKRHKIYFESEEVPFTRIPYMIIGAEKLFCAHGKDFNKSQKEKRKIEEVTFKSSVSKILLILTLLMLNQNDFTFLYPRHTSLSWL